MQPVQVTVESDNDEDKNQDEWVEEAVDAEERRQRQLTMLAAPPAQIPINSSNRMRRQPQVVSTYPLSIHRRFAAG